MRAYVTAKNAAEAQGEITPTPPTGLPPIPSASAQKKKKNLFPRPSYGPFFAPDRRARAVVDMLSAAGHAMEFRRTAFMRDTRRWSGRDDYTSTTQDGRTWPHFWTSDDAFITRYTGLHTDKLGDFRRIQASRELEIPSSKKKKTISWRCMHGARLLCGIKQRFTVLQFCGNNNSFCRPSLLD